MRAVVLLVSSLALASAFPKSLKPTQSSDEKSEMIPSQVIESNEGYELREYPASKWVCTQQEVDVTQDSMADWQSKFESPYDAVASNAFEDSPSSRMFMKLFKYILGVNKGSQEIEMTRPVTTKKTPTNEEGVEVHEMCFWTGSPWEDKDLPQPIDSKVYLQDRDALQVYVRQFDGWAMSEDDWEEHYVELMNALEGKQDVEDEVYYTAGYNSPYTSQGRRNEIWIPRQVETSQRLTQENQGEDTEEYRTERVPYDVLFSNEDYELRRYNASKWVCTMIKDDDTSDDFLKGWQDRYNSPFEAMSDRKRHEKNSPRRKMFRYLYQYISGVNKDFAEIEMSSPVTKKHVVKPGTTLEDLEMCFWTGSPWADKKNPEPLKEQVYLQDRPEMFVYTRSFGGWALSFDDWNEVHNELKEVLGDRQYDEDAYFTAGYNSPWDTTNRKNEVWLPVQKEDIDPMYLNN